MRNSPSYAIVIGASAGGLSALKDLVETFEKGLDAAICVVLHITVLNETRFFVQQLQAHTALVCEEATDGALLESDHIYIAPADRHLVLSDHKLLVGRGPKENRWRPSIDTLFRSAAAHFTSRAIGIILTGLMDDGVSGMAAIKKSKGKCIVLHPDEAEFPEMPLAVIENVGPHYSLPLKGIFPVLKTITKKRTKKTKAPREVVAESNISERTAVGIGFVEPLGENSVYSCPDCGGNLWRIHHNGNDRYRCHTGHTYTERQLLLKQVDSLETTLWTAMRMMEERRHLVQKIYDQQLKSGHKRMAAISLEQVNQMAVHIKRLRDILFSGQADPDNDVSSR
jgi:two-component system, chemotaxis family, protein-glutamate methylesterase/glutaminase